MFTLKVHFVLGSLSERFKWTGHISTCKIHDRDTTYKVENCLKCSLWCW